MQHHYTIDFEGHPVDDESENAFKRDLVQIGTLSGNPVAAAAGLKTLEILRRPGAYERPRGLHGRHHDLADQAQRRHRPRR